MTNRPEYWGTRTEDERADYDAYDPFKEKGNGKDWTKPHIGEERGLVIVRADDVSPTAVDWIWDGRIARGKLTIIAGAPDVGKSQIGAYIASRVTNGKHWPNGARAPQGDVVILASEDSIEDTWVPRLIAAGADLARVYFVKMVIDERGKRRTFNLQSDLDALGETLNALQKPQLVTIDPITSYLGKVDAHRTPDVRALRRDASAESTRHGKNAFTGSIAFVATARIAFIVIDEPETERRLMLPVKNNVGIKAQGRCYSIAATIVAENISAPYIIWDDAPVDMTADQAIVAAAKHAKEGGRSLKEAIEFLRELLANGPVGATDAEEAATKEGISSRTLRRARKELGIVPQKGDFVGGWSWSL